MRNLQRLLLLFAAFATNPAHGEIRVTVEGVDDTLRENVIAMLGIYEYRGMEDVTEPMVRRLHARAPGEIRRALTPFGYYHVEIDSDLQRVAADWQARYRIRRGPVVRIDTVDIRVIGDKQARETFAAGGFTAPFRKGDPLRHQHYEDFKRQLLNLANDNGYLDAQFTVQRLAVDTERLRADIELELETGEQYYFGEVEFEQRILNDEFVRRFMNFEPGEPLSYNRLLDLQYALTDSEYFSTVNIQAERELAEDRHIPVRVTAQEKRRTRYTAGLGYGTDTGPRLSLGFQRRYVNRRGHRLGIETMFSEVENSFSSRYIIPLADPTVERLQLSAGTIRQDRGDAESRRLTFGISRIHVIGDWEQTLYVRGEREDSILPDLEFETDNFMPGVSWQKTRADDLFYTRKGYRLFADVRLAHPSLGSDSEFGRVHLVGKRIFPFGDRWRLLLRAEAGANFIDDAAELPVSQRYFAGGDQSVRGFDFNRLATRDADNNVIGGKYLAAGSAEIEYRFAENWAVAAFSDTGNAMNDIATSLETSYGVGLRWLSPVGVLRVDFARQIDSELTDVGNFRLHISIGPDL